MVVHLPEIIRSHCCRRPLSAISLANPAFHITLSSSVDLGGSGGLLSRSSDGANTVDGVACRRGAPEARPSMTRPKHWQALLTIVWSSLARHLLRQGKMGINLATSAFVFTTSHKWRQVDRAIRWTIMRTRTTDLQVSVKSSPSSCHVHSHLNVLWKELKEECGGRKSASIKDVPGMLTGQQAQTGNKGRNPRGKLEPALVP